MAYQRQFVSRHHTIRFYRTILAILLCVGACCAGIVPGIAPAPTVAQLDPAPCGLVEEFAFPVPEIDVARNDFGIYRARFGGLHVGIDVAFEQLGMPVQAAGRGQVTYSDPAGWDTEKGVVVIQHTLADGTIFNTLYGHMEELNGYIFPEMFACVEPGDVIGAIGFPSQGRPHLHYEIRTRYRHEGGPGYTETNPLELGWLHPVDFTYLVRLRVSPAYQSHITLTEPASLPPLLQNDVYIFAHSQRLTGTSSDGTVLWNFDTLQTAIALAALPDGRTLILTADDQVLVLDQGSFSALWQLPKTVISAPLLVGPYITFITTDYSVLALTADGQIAWESTALPSEPVTWATNTQALAIASESNELWVIDAAGNVIQPWQFATLPQPFTGPDDSFAVVSGSEIWSVNHITGARRIAEIDQTVAEGAVMNYTPDGSLLLYPGTGRALYAYNGQDGRLLWNAYMPGSHMRPPRLAVGSGAWVYVLTTDGQLLTYSAQTGRLVARAALFDGGVDGAASTRWLHVTPDDRITFSSGFISLVTLDGQALAENKISQGGPVS